jgi:hypothetical protein
MPERPSNPAPGKPTPRTPAPRTPDIVNPSCLPSAFDSQVAPAAASGYVYQVAYSQHQELLERSKFAGKVLAVKYDHLNQMIAATEEFFKSLKCPTHTYIGYNDSHNEDCGITDWETLGFIRFHDKWRIVHAFCNSDEIGILNNLQPLADCPISVRVTAANEIERLYKAIIEQKEKFIPEVDNAINEFVKFHQFINDRKGVQNG